VDKKIDSILARPEGNFVRKSHLSGGGGGGGDLPELRDQEPPSPPKQVRDIVVALVVTARIENR
jgi:hypothetical protein